MNNEPNLSLDVDALFEHMINLGHEVTNEMNWEFSLRSRNVAQLEQVADQFGDEFELVLQDEVEEIDEDGNSSVGPALLRIIQCGALTATEVKAIATRVSDMASNEGLVYEGVACFDAIDEDELFGWLELEDATWRLQHFTDAGLAKGGELPWVFLLLTEELDRLKETEKALRQTGYDRITTYDEPDEDGLYGICLFMDGTNDEGALTETFEKISELAKKHGTQVEGVQFFTEDELNEIYEDQELEDDDWDDDEEDDDKLDDEDSDEMDEDELEDDDDE